MNWVVYPPPFAMWGKATGAGAGWSMSATGNVVISISSRSFASVRSVRAANGDVELISRTPVNPPGSPAMN